MIQQASFDAFRSSVTNIPAEDTFLLLDSLEKDVEQLKNQNPLICLEIG